MEEADRVEPFWKPHGKKANFQFGALGGLRGVSKTFRNKRQRQGVHGRAFVFMVDIYVHEHVLVWVLSYKLAVSLNHLCFVFTGKSKTLLIFDSSRFGFLLLSMDGASDPHKKLYISHSDDTFRHNV